jgi:hypothetical protein
MSKQGNMDGPMYLNSKYIILKECPFKHFGHLKKFIQDQTQLDDIVEGISI